MRSARCQALEGWHVILGIHTTDLGAEETSEHSECSSQFWDLVEMYLAKSSTLACSLPRSCRPGLDHDAFFVLGIEKWAHDAITVAQQHSRDRSVSHGHALPFSAVELRILREVPMVHCENVDGQRFTSVPILQDPTSSMRITAQRSRSMALNDRRLNPWNRRERSSLSTRSQSPLPATDNDQIYNILEQGIKPGKSSTHVHLASIDDAILDDEPSKAALTHVPGGRDALLILGFLKNAALSEDTIGPQNIMRRTIPKDRKRRPSTRS